MSISSYSALRNAHRPNLSRLLPLDFPLSLYVETTNRCNFRCRYCPLSVDGYATAVGGFKTMALSEFKKIAKDIQKGGFVKVLRFYFMGEPLLNPELPEMITMACGMGLAERTELTTNGVLMDSITSRALIRSRLDYLRISVSSVDPKRHRKITQSAIGIEKVQRNISEFRNLREQMNKNKPFLYIKMLDSLDDSENAKFLETYGDLGDEISIEKPMNWNSYDNLDLFQATYEKNQEEYLTELYPYPKDVCPFPFYNLTVNVNGDVIVCCVDWNKATKVGNVFEESLHTIWHGDALRRLRQLHIDRLREKNPSCHNCHFLFTTPDNLDGLSETQIASILRTGK